MVICFLTLIRRKLIIGTLINLIQFNDDAGTGVQFAVFVLGIGSPCSIAVVDLAV